MTVRIHQEIDKYKVTFTSGAQPFFEEYLAKSVSIRLSERASCFEMGSRRTTIPGSLVRLVPVGWTASRHNSGEADVWRSSWGC